MSRITGRHVLRSRGARLRSPCRSSCRASRPRCTHTGASLLRPYTACKRSACSVLVGKPGARAAALNVDDDERQLDGDRETDGLHLERHARAARARDAEVAGVGRADRRANRGDLVLGLDRRDAEVLVLAELVQDVARRRDRVGAEHERRGPLSCGGRDQTERGRGVAADVAVHALVHGRRRHLVAMLENLRGFAVGVPGLERGDVGGDELGSLAELALRST